MANQLFSALNGNNRQNANPMQQLIADAQRLKQTVKNPRAEVERLMQTGAMSQQKFNELAKIAQQVVKFME